MIDTFSSQAWLDMGAAKAYVADPYERMSQDRQAGLYKGKAQIA